MHIDDEVNVRTAEASAATGGLRGNVWNQSGIRLDTKLKVYKAAVLPTLLYACETWTVYQWHTKRPNHFHTSYLRKLLKIKWQDRIPDTEVLKRAGMQSVHTLLKLAQLRWTDLVTRMPEERLPKKILYGELEMGKCSHGGHQKRYKDTLKASLKDFNIPTESWEQITQDRAKWRGLIRWGASDYETKRIRKAKQKCAKPELRHHQQSCPALTSVVPPATYSLELELILSAILEYTNSSISLMWLRLVIVSNDRRTTRCNN